MRRNRSLSKKMKKHVKKISESNLSLSRYKPVTKTSKVNIQNINIGT